MRSSSFDAEAVQSGVPAGTVGLAAENASGKPQVPDPAEAAGPEPVDRRVVRVKAPAVGQSAGSIDVRRRTWPRRAELPSAVLPVSGSARRLATAFEQRRDDLADRQP